MYPPVLVVRLACLQVLITFTSWLAFLSGTLTCSSVSAADLSVVAPALQHDELCVGSDSLSAGNYHESHRDVKVEGVGPSAEITRVLNTRMSSETGWFGPGWYSGIVDARLEFNDSDKTAGFRSADG